MKLKGLYMKFSLSKLTLLLSVSIVTPAYAGKEVCKEILNEQEVLSEYITKPGKRVETKEVFESPDGKFYAVATQGEATENYSTHVTSRITIRNRRGDVKTQINHAGSPVAGDNHTLYLNRAVYSPNGRKILLLIDDPHKRDAFGKSNQFALFDTKTGKRKTIKSGIELGSWKEEIDHDRQERFPAVFSADSKTLYLTDQYGIEIVNVNSGKQIGFIGRKQLGYKSRLDQFNKDDEFENSDIYEYQRIQSEEQLGGIAFSPDRTRILVTFAKDRPVFYDLKAKKVIKKLGLDQDDLFTHFALESNDTAIGILSSRQMEVVRWNVNTGRKTVVYSNPSRKTEIASLTHRNGMSVIQVVEKHRDSITETYFSISSDSDDVTKFASSTYAAAKQLKNREGYDLKPSRVEVGNNGEYSLILPDEHEYFGSTILIFNNKTGAYVGKIDDAKSARFSGSGKSVLYQKQGHEDETINDRFSKIDLP